MKKVLLSFIAAFSLIGISYAAPVPDFVELSAQIKPAVVNIRTVKTRPVANRRALPPSAFGNDDFFREFFDRFFSEAPNGAPRKERSLGSGFVISEDGYILTNNHVIKNVDEISVRLANGHSYKGTLKGSDEKLDIALIKIDAPKEKLAVVKMGDSEKLQVGEWVIAIGNPFGLEQTVTVGIVSAKGRVIGAGPYDNFIQTDASINPGNSGGPLFNAQGEVVGINTAIIRGGQGIGFATPINVARNILPQLKKTGKVVRGWLGVAVQVVTPELAKSYGLEEAQGALVAEVIKGSPAEKCGIQPEDIILSFDGKEVNMLNDLPRLVADRAVGEKVTIVVLRDGKNKKTFTATLVQSPEDGENDNDNDGEPSSASLLGLQVEDVTPNNARFYRLKEGSRGALVVRSSGLAAENGIRPGDLIQQIDKTPVTDAASFSRAVKKLKKGQVVRLLVKRGSTALYTAMMIE